LYHRIPLAHLAPACCSWGFSADFLFFPGWTMDCRRSLVLTLALVSGLVGCSLTGTQQAPLKTEGSPAFADASIEVKPPRDLPPRAPKAKTCVEYGKCREDEARAPGRTPAEQEAMLDQARRMYQQALQAEPKNLEAARSLARLYARQGDHERAVATY